MLFTNFQFNIQMESLPVAQCRQALRQDPIYLLQSILDNNLAQVCAKLKFYFNVTVNTAEDAAEQIKLIVQADPDNAAQNVYDILSVPIIGTNLSSVGSEAILNEAIAAEAAGQSITR